MNLLLLLVSLVAVTNDSSSYDSLTARIIAKTFSPEWVISFADGRILLLNRSPQQAVYHETEPVNQLLPSDSILAIYRYAKGKSQTADQGNIIPDWVVYYPQMAVYLGVENKRPQFKTVKTRGVSGKLERRAQMVIYYPKLNLTPEKRAKLAAIPKEKAINWIASPNQPEENH